MEGFINNIDQHQIQTK